MIFLIIFPLLGTLSLVLVFLGIFFILQRKRQTPQTNQTNVAVKKLQSFRDGEITQKKEYLNEIRTLTEIQHQNIIKLHGFCSHSQHSFFIYEYLKRGSLATILSNDGGAKELD